MSTTKQCDFCKETTQIKQDYMTLVEERWCGIRMTVNGLIHRSIEKDICPDCIKKLNLRELKDPASLETLFRNWIQEEVALNMENE